MGYSCTVKADNSLDELIIQLKAAGSEIETSNGWMIKDKRYFFQRGREQKDGAITGSVHKHTGERTCKNVGSFRIKPNGRIIRFPTSTKIQREIAELTAEARR